MLDEMLENASDFTDEEIDTQLTSGMMALVEPLMLVFMALVVAIHAAVDLPTR